MLPQMIGVSESLIVVFERHATAKTRAAAAASDAAKARAGATGAGARAGAK
jgi:hypothetical protein